MAEQSTVNLVVAVVTREATRWRGDEASPYSWGTGLLVAPGHARDTAVAVVRALRSAGRLSSPARLADFGRHGWAFGWLFGAVTAGIAERHVWPWWAYLGAGVASFATGMVGVGWAARRAAGRAEG